MAPKEVMEIYDFFIEPFEYYEKRYGKGLIISDDEIINWEEYSLRKSYFEEHREFFMDIISKYR